MITEGNYRIFTLHPIDRSKLYLKVELGSAEPPRVIAVPSDGNPEQHWRLTSSQDSDKPDFFWVTNVSNDLVLTLLSEDHINPDPKSHLVCKIGSLALWRFEKDPNSNQLRLFSDIGLQPERFCVTIWFDLDAGSDSCAFTARVRGETSKREGRVYNQLWALEPVHDAPAPAPAPAPAQPIASGVSNTPLSTDSISPNELQCKYFTLTAHAARDAGPYDIIIVGTGIGGGVLAGDLFDTNSKLGDGAKRILVIERGSLVFHSYCLNSAKPGGVQKDRGHQNGLFFSTFRSKYNVDGPGNALDDWRGGPMYCLGGRSTTWGLYAPRIHDTTLQTYFTPAVCTALTTEFYEKAERLMNLALPNTKTIHQHVIERLNMDPEGRKVNVQWQWGRTASEVRPAGSSKGAFSTTEKLLEIAMSKPDDQAEHENFKILLGVEAREIVWKEGGGFKRAGGVRVKTASGDEIDIQVVGGGKVVLCAGSVATPAILLRSGVDLPEGSAILRDHEILYKVRSFRYKVPSVRAEVGPMKLQTYVDLGENNVALANICLDSSGFLPRGKGANDDIPRFAITFTTKTPLEWQGEVQLDNAREPVLKISKQSRAETQRNRELAIMERLTKAAMKTVQETLKVEFFDERLDEADEAEVQAKIDHNRGWRSPGNGRPTVTTRKQFFQRMGMGAVGHEMGTVPMAGPNEEMTPVDEDLRLSGAFKGVYVCDLSVFPGLPEANPSLTLAALSIRLSRSLLPRLTPGGPTPNELKVVNHSGDTIEVWVSNRAKVIGSGQNKNVKIGPGEHKSWARRKGIHEAVFVFRRNPRERGEVFFPAHELLLGVPGSLLPIM
ncbi:hypothetical protein FRC04_003301 [Tulasnella sp. 424]|nr:hypothetical protein FRC04_003301 [Tulasnella sp. 424]KAG8965816.1 hypothetical protein FRC05_002997 [Tulasnella sp. 425]